MGWIFSDARRDERPEPRPAPKLPAWIRFEDPADAHPVAAGIEDDGLSFLGSADQAVRTLMAKNVKR